jgi:hypothetical protein
MQHRLKHLLWRIAWNALPVRVNLFKYIPSISFDEWVCPICNGPQESIQHVFLGCIFAKTVWRTSRWPLNTESFAALPIEVWIKAIIKPHELLGIPINEVHHFQLSGFYYYGSDLVCSEQQSS